MPLSPFYQHLRAKIGPDLLLIPGVCGIVLNPKGELLLQRRTDSGKWGLPGGMLDPGEHPAEALVRELLEEAAVLVRPDRITGVYLTRVVTYSNGDRSQFLITAFRCTLLRGEARVNDEESLEMTYFPLNALPELHGDHRLRIEHALADRPAFFVPAVLPKDVEKPE